MIGSDVVWCTSSGSHGRLVALRDVGGFIFDAVCASRCRFVAEGKLQHSSPDFGRHGYVQIPKHELRMPVHGRAVTVELGSLPLGGSLAVA